MIHPAPAATQGLATGGTWAPALAFAAGAAGSLSPCVAPRMLAVAALCANKPGKTVVLTVSAFTAGLVAAYSALSVAGTFLWKAAAHSGDLYAALAVVMAVAGGCVLFRHTACRSTCAPRPAASMSATFLLGASSAAGFSPCCMPVVAAAAMYARNSGILFACFTVACFAMGHAVPLMFAGAGSRIVGLAMDGGIQSAARVVSGALMLALAGLYAVLA